MSNDDWTLDEWLAAISLGSLCLGAFPIAAITGGILGIRKTARPIGNGLKATGKGIGKGIVVTASGTKRLLTPKPKPPKPVPRPEPPTKQERIQKQMDAFNDTARLIMAAPLFEYEKEIAIDEERNNMLHRIKRIINE